MSDLPSVKMKKRANAVVMLATFLFATFVIINLFKITIVDAQIYQDHADSNQFGATTIPANRGSIYSSDGKIFAQSATVFRICIDPKVYQEYDDDEKENLVNYLSSKLNISKDKILNAVERNSRYEILAKQIEKPVRDELSEYLKENEFYAVYSEEDTKRYYPQDNLAASVVGFLNSDGKGQYGIEYKYDEYLSGVDGVTISAQDAFGDQMPYKYSKLYEAKDGNSIYLTIDTMIQYYVESALDWTVDYYNAAENGCAIVMNAKTGAIYAMYTAPGFDPNNKGVLPTETQELLDSGKSTLTEAELLEKMWKNKAISTTCEPGSVFKVFTSAAALEEKTVSFDSTFECKGYLEVSGVRIYCHATSGHTGLPILTFKQALANSCNPSFMQIGLALGGEKFSYYADAFGLRERTGIDLPSESNSYFAPLEGTYGLAESDVTLASSAFGQTNTLTPIQMVAGYAAAINGGYLVQPYVVDKIVDSNQNVVKKTETTIKRQVISEETSALMREALQNNVDSKNTGNAYIPGYKIGGKSGTAEKLAAWEEAKTNYKALSPELQAVTAYPQKQYVASYCAFAPADDPEIVVYVMVDEPDQSINYYGSTIAAPCVTKIMENVLPYLGYQPEYTEEEQLIMDVRVPDVEKLSVDEAVSALKDAGFEADIRGDGASVQVQVPSFTSSMPSGGKVILYTESGYEEKEIIMPDLIKMSIGDVNKLFAELGLNLKATGSKNEKSIALSQSISANSIVKEGTIVTVHFGINDQTG